MDWPIGAVAGDAWLVAKLVGNEAIESAAIDWVMGLEHAAGREPRDVRYTGAPCDIVSPLRFKTAVIAGYAGRGLPLWAGWPWPWAPQGRCWAAWAFLLRRKRYQV
jgi:hypothetical protein